MNKKGVILVFTLMVLLILAILMVSFFLKSISEARLANRFVNSTRAFWLAEAGIAEAKNRIPVLSSSGYIGEANYTFNAQSQLITSGYYSILSTGTVTLPNGEVISRQLNAIVKTGQADPAKFKYAIETTTTLVIKGRSVDINPDNSYKQNSALDFTDLFGYTKTDVKNNATHLYTPSSFTSPVDGITWVEVPSGQTFTLSGNLAGGGVLVVSGNTHLSGTVDFNGIIYVIGELTITGSVVINGSVLAESSADVDTELKGNVTLNYNIPQITDALTNLGALEKDIVSWNEI
ncbi:hypothetical protein D4R78_01530 [bacterium]|nr:MAG: hypothetical protein D4R78_01530 [bacterium]